MKKQIVVLIFLVMSISSFAQDTTVVGKSIENPVLETESADSLALIDKHIDMYQFRKALDVLATMKPDKTLLEKKALCHSSLYEYPQAIEIMEKLTKENPKDVSLKLKLIALYEPTQKYSKIITCYDELVELDPTNDYYKIQRANFLYSRENYEGALEQYKNVCDSCDNNFLVKRLAMCYEKLNDTKNAKYLYARAWDLDTTDGFSATSLVKFLIKDRQYDLALFASDRYIAIDSTYTPMNSLNAFVYYCMDQYDEAARRFTKCLEKKDSSLLVTRSLGYAHFFMERDSLANFPLQLAYNKDTMDNKVLYPLAQTYFHLGDYPKAIELYEKLLKRKIPTEEELYNYYEKLGEAYYNNKDYVLAVGKFHMAESHVIEYKDKVELHKKMAFCFDYDLNDYGNALDHYEKYRSGLLSREISLGGVEDDLSKLNLSEDLVSKINEVRKEMGEIDVRIAYLKENLNGTIQTINGQRVLIRETPDGKKTISFLGREPDSVKVATDSSSVQKKPE